MPLDESHYQRASDSDIHKQILDLIEKEPNATDRTKLLVMLRFATLMMDNINVVASVAKDIEDHKKTCSKIVEEAVDEMSSIKPYFAKWKNVSNTLTMVSVLVIGLATVIYNDRVSDINNALTRYEDVRKTLNDLSIQISELQIKSNISISTKSK